jgi:hypothetical protein
VPTRSGASEPLTTIQAGRPADGAGVGRVVDLRRTAPASSAPPGSSCRTGPGNRSRCRRAARSAPPAGRPHAP